MATNYVQPGESLILPAPSGGVVANRVYLIGSVAMVALETAAETVPCAFAVGGVWEFPKDGTAAVNFAAGEFVFWNPTTNIIAKTATGNIKVGYAVAAAANAATTVRVKLTEAETSAVA